MNTGAVEIKTDYLHGIFKIDVALLLDTYFKGNFYIHHTQKHMYIFGESDLFEAHDYGEYIFPIYDFQLKEEAKFVRTDRLYSK